MDCAQEQPVETLTNRFPIIDVYLEDVIKHRRFRLSSVAHPSLQASEKRLRLKTWPEDILSFRVSFLPGNVLSTYFLVFINTNTGSENTPFFEEQFPFVEVVHWIDEDYAALSASFSSLQGPAPNTIQTTNLFVSR